MITPSKYKTEEVEDDEFVLEKKDTQISQEEEGKEDVKAQLKNITEFLEDLKKKVGDTQEGLRKMKTLQAVKNPVTKPSLQQTKTGIPPSPLMGDPFNVSIKYKSVDDDIVDKMLERYIETHKVKVPIHRIDQSKYLFGTRVIAAQIINGVLMVRVGGGFMSIEEFLDKHTNKEILNLKLKMTKERKKLPKITQELLQQHKIKKFI